MAVLLALLAALVQAAMAVLVPLPAPPIVPLTAAEQYAQFVSAFGPEPLCTAEDDAGIRAPSGRHPMSGGMHDCPLCPICSTLRHIATLTAPPPSASSVLHPPLLATAGHIPTDRDVFPATRRALSPANPRAPPALT